jgi:hypothetical protein
VKIALSNYGWCVASALIKRGQLRLGENPETDILLNLFTGWLAPEVDSAIQRLNQEVALVTGHRKANN